MDVLELRSGEIRSAVSLFSKRLSHSYRDNTTSHPLSDETGCPTVDVDALLSIIVDAEFEHYLADQGIGSFSLEAIIEWFILETLDNIGNPCEDFYLALKEYSMELSSIIIEQISEHRRIYHGHLRYHFERRTHGGCIRLRQVTDSS